MNWSWKYVAETCEQVYGVHVDWEERFFICPECDEPIYEADWDLHDWTMCPICEFAFEGE